MSRAGNRAATVLFSGAAADPSACRTWNCFITQRSGCSKRGVLRSAVVRQATVQLSTYDSEHIGRLNAPILRLLDELASLTAGAIELIVSLFY
jgi:hypothetical protein